MRTLPPGLQEHLASGASTMCQCWRLVRADGLVLGFTDHDRSITFDGVTFEGGGGFEGSHIDAQAGFSVGGSEVSGVLQSDRLNESDLLNGAYDNARVEIWRVNWADPQQRIMLDVATLGEVRRSDIAFTAELRSLAHWLDQERGRVFQAECSADLGDARCRVDIASQPFRTLCNVAESLSLLRLRVDAAGFAHGWFSAGTIRFVDGANAGAWQGIEKYTVKDGSAVVALWSAPGSPVAAGTAVELTAGCDKRFATCRSKFANLANFRGFPHMPGNDALLSHPGSSDGPMDGGSMNR